MRLRDKNAIEKNPAKMAELEEHKIKKAIQCKRVGDTISILKSFF